MSEEIRVIEFVGGPRCGERLAVPPGTSIWAIAKPAAVGSMLGYRYNGVGQVVRGLYRMRDDDKHAHIFDWQGWEDE